MEDVINKPLKRNSPQSEVSSGAGGKVKSTRRGLAYLTNVEFDQLSEPSLSDTPSVYTSQINIFKEQKRTTEKFVAKQLVLLNSQAEQKVNEVKPQKTSETDESDTDINFDLPPTPPPPAPRLTKDGKERKQRKSKQTDELAKVIRSLEYEQTNLLIEQAAGHSLNTSIGSMDKSICLDDNYLAQRDIALRISAFGQILRYTTSTVANFSKVFIDLSSMYGTPVDRVLLTLNDKKICQSDTPQSIGLSITDILEFGAINDDTAQEMAMIDAADTRNTLLLKVQCKNSRTKVEIRIKNTDRMSKLMEIYAQETGQNLNKLSFKFDGDQIQPDDTPENLELENGYCLDAIVHSEIR